MTIPGSNASSGAREMACLAARSAKGAVDHTSFVSKTCKTQFKGFVPFTAISSANSNARSTPEVSGAET